LRQLTGIDNAGRVLLLAMRLADVRLVVEDVWMKGLIERVTGNQFNRGREGAVMEKEDSRENQHSGSRRNNK
jgi:hypothetical protein